MKKILMIALVMASLCVLSSCGGDEGSCARISASSFSAK